jgi:hypothetical protein
MERGLVLSLGAIGAVIVIGLLARAAAKRSGETPGVISTNLPMDGDGPEAARTEPGAAAEPADDAGDPMIVEDDADEFAAVTVDGVALVAESGVVRLVPAEVDDPTVPFDETKSVLQHRRMLGRGWRPGDLTGARVVPGGSPAEPWLLEHVGLEGEYAAFAFATREQAEAALALLHELDIVQPGADDAGRRLDSSAECFARVKPDTPEPALPPGDGPGPGEPDESEVLEDVSIVAVERDGCALAAWDSGVRELRPLAVDERWKAGVTYALPLSARTRDSGLDAGRFIAGRVVPDVDGSWRLELLGPENDYAEFVFETRDAADAALKLCESCEVIFPREAEDGEPEEQSAPAAAEQFDAARQVYVETLASFAAQDEGEGEEGSDGTRPGGESAPSRPRDPDVPS